MPATPTSRHSSLVAVERLWRSSAHLACAFFLVLVSGCAHVSAPFAVGGAVESPAGFTAACQRQTSDARAALARLEALAPPHTPASVLEPLDRLEQLIGDTGQLAGLYEAVHPDPAVRAAAQACRQQIADIGTALGLSRPVYDAVAAVQPAQLDASALRYRDKLLREYRLHGIDRPDAVREQLRQLGREIESLEQQFEQNIREDRRHVVLGDAADLAGLPRDFIDAHPQDSSGVIRISTDYPDYLPVMRYARSDELRRRLYIEFNNRGYPANARVLAALLAKRSEYANLLGQPSYAALQTSDKMAGSPARIRAMIDQVDALAQPAAAREQAALLKVLRQEVPGALQVQPWQQAYALERIRREQFAVDSSELRRYFPYAQTRDGIFALVGQMFGLQIRPWHTDVWHPSVQAYELMERGRVIGRFYLDMHPREGKYGHAAQFPVVTGVEGRALPVAALVCNLPGAGDPAALLEHADVETMLHEFGHLLHHLLGGQQRWVAQSGVATEWDFVEVPSQMLEEWVWSPEVLARFARDGEGRAIPPDLVRAMVASRHLGRGVQTRQQLFYASLSLALHEGAPSAPPDIEPVASRLQARYSPHPQVPGTHFYASFDHLSGYSALYYSYLWSEVIAADMFSRFQREGLLNPATAAAYRRAVLAPGGSRAAAELVQDFLSRPYDARAFARRLAEAAQLGSGL